MPVVFHGHRLNFLSQHWRCRLSASDMPPLNRDQFQSAQSQRIQQIQHLTRITCNQPASGLRRQPELCQQFMTRNREKSHLRPRFQKPQHPSHRRARRVPQGASPDSCEGFVLVERWPHRTPSSMKGHWPRHRQIVVRVQECTEERGAANTAR